MIVVADTSPLNYLIQLGMAHLLPNLYGTVMIPGGVLEELLAEGAPGAVQSWAGSPPAWLTVVEVGPLDTSLPDDLGKGELEAISLGLHLGGALLLIDDQGARIAAEARSLEVTGTLAILAAASSLGLVMFEEALAGLLRLGFRASASVLSTVRTRVSRSDGREA